MAPPLRSGANPKRLNALQLRTLAVLQAMARDPALAEPPDADGSVLIRMLPQPHGDHFHIAGGIVSARDASGLSNRHVFEALVRKGLLLAGPAGMPILTAQGLAYDTSAAGRVLRSPE
jgi:hypothetical protein